MRQFFLSFLIIAHTIWISVKFDPVTFLFFCVLISVDCTKFFIIKRFSILTFCQSTTSCLWIGWTNSRALESSKILRPRLQIGKFSPDHFMMKWIKRHVCVCQCCWKAPIVVIWINFYNKSGCFFWNQVWNKNSISALLSFHEIFCQMSARQRFRQIGKHVARLCQKRPNVCSWKSK